ncbi:MAG TPA: hypothetical protein H9902_06615 [Candidatus Stackebrandtia faecavium]|nr:hypothetical protein [Candidatus Stackebrandtia faecavium]
MPRDDRREVAFDDEPQILPDQTRDDTPTGWGDENRYSRDDNDERLLAERPPHWD